MPPVGYRGVMAQGLELGEIPGAGRRRRVRQPGRLPVQLRPQFQAAARRQRRGGAGAGPRARRGGDRHRPAHAEDDRPRPAEGGARAPPRRGRHHRHRLHRRRRAHRVDQPGAHLPLRHQALGLEGAARRAHPRRRAVRAACARTGGSRSSSRAYVGMLSKEAHGAFNFGAIVGESPGAARRAGAGRAGGADVVDGAPARRDRHRQGDGGARHPHQQRPRVAPVRAGELRGARARRARVGAVRAREGVVHRARSRGGSAASSWPTAARCSSTRSATCRSTSR